MQLRTFQNSFEDHMIRRSNNIDENFAALCKTGHIALPERMRVYRDNIIGGLAALLDDVFPSLAAIAGQEFAAQVFREFVRINLPGEGCLDTYGADLPDFIENFPPAAGLPYLSDVLRLDLAINRAEYAPDDKPLKAEILQQKLQTGDFNLRLRSSAHVISSPYPLHTIRVFALDPENEKKDVPDIHGRPECVLVYRAFLKADTIRLEPDECDLLQQLYQNKPLEQSLENTLEKHSAFSFEKFLQKFISLEAFQDV